MAKNITISLSTVFNGSGIKSAIYGMQEMQNVTKNVQQSLEGAKSKWEQMRVFDRINLSLAEFY